MKKLVMLFCSSLFLLFTSCSSSSFIHENVVVSKDFFELKLKVPSEDNKEWENKTLMYYTFFISNSKIYPLAYQTWERRYREFDYNPIHVFNIYNPKLPLYDCYWQVLLNPKDPKFRSEKSKLWVPRKISSPEDMKLVYLFWRFPSVEWPSPESTSPNDSTQFACLVTSYEELRRNRSFSVEDLHFKDMNEIVKDKTLYELIIFNFTHPQYYNMCYRKPTFKDEDKRYYGIDKYKTKALKDAYRYAEKLHALYEKHNGGAPKDLPHLILKQESYPVDFPVKIQIIKVKDGTSVESTTHTINVQDFINSQRND